MQYICSDEEYNEEYEDPEDDSGDTEILFSKEELDVLKCFKTTYGLEYNDFHDYHILTKPEELEGHFPQSHCHLCDKALFSNKYKCISCCHQICSDCNEKGKQKCWCSIKTHDRTKEVVVNHITTLNYKIVAIKKTEDTFIYVVKFRNCDFSQVDSGYYLKVCRKGKLILNWNIETYNPYFGCHSIKLDWNEDESMAHIIYKEKHGLCEKYIKLDSEDNEVKSDTDTYHLIKYRNA